MEGPLWQTGCATGKILAPNASYEKKGSRRIPCGGEVTLKHLSSLTCREAGADQNESFTPAQPAWGAPGPTNRVLLYSGPRTPEASPNWPND